MQYFVRTLDVRKESRYGASISLVKRLYPELACSSVSQAIDQAKRRVLKCALLLPNSRGEL